MSVRAAYWTTLLRPPRAVQFPFTLSGGAGSMPNLLTGDGLTIECWVYVEAYTNPPGQYHGSDYRQLLVLGDASTGYSFLYSLIQGKLHFYSYNGESVQAQAATPVKTWQHLAVVIKFEGTAASLRMYLDGQPAALQGQEGYSKSLMPLKNTSVWHVGHINSDRSNGALYGKLAQLRLWKTPRTAEEINKEYRSSNSYLLLQNNAPNLLACYDFSEETGAIFLSPAAGNALLADGSGNGRHLGSSSNSWENSTVVSTVPLLR